MLQANKEMEDKIKDSIYQGEEPEDLITFGQMWKNRLQLLKSLDKERENMKGHIKFVFFLLIFGLIFSILNVIYGSYVTKLLGSKLSFNTVGWLLTLTAFLFMFLYQNFFRKLLIKLNESEQELFEVITEITEEETVRVYRITNPQQ